MAFECLGTVGAVDPDRCEISDEKTEMFLVSNFSDHNELHTFLTYAIQELLRFCRFTPDLVDNWLLRLITLVENKDATDIFLPFLGTIRNGDSVILQKLLPHIALHIVISGPPEELENMRLEIVTVLEDQVERGSGFSPEGRQLVAQTIFGLMDHFSRWIRDRQKAQGENGGSKEQTLIQREALLNIEQQIVKLEGGHVASGQSMIVDEPTDVISPQKQLQKYYEKAHEIYAAVDKPDGMEDSLRAEIVGVLQRHPDWERELAPLSVESSLVLNNWEGLSRAVQVGSLESPEVIFGKVVDVLLNSDEQAFNEAMKDARIRLGNQILEDVRLGNLPAHFTQITPDRQACCNSSPAAPSSKITLKAGLTTGRNLMNHLDFWLESISPAFRYRKQLLRLRRATFQLRSRGAPAVSQLWVQTAKIARKAGHLQTAYSAVLQASESKAPTAFIQQAKLMKLEDLGNLTHEAIQDVIVVWEVDFVATQLAIDLDPEHMPIGHWVYSAPVPSTALFIVDVWRGGRETVRPGTVDEVELIKTSNRTSATLCTPFSSDPSSSSSELFALSF
ncbi:hypothetical protein PtA15_16A359 [Puccinia triticina]|uniref:non-specific serine/threonine protein kinase n=1 Tax=Puccinia triticina TaxID=208348 RepID=A0ABY7D4A2_9BASI|nr:uncharacterized protein PtA15_16A359 [Puccinia triticina]WAQ92451.1 hypothetical protein PtA15_16A359 [Puccinia triticina]